MRYTSDKEEATSILNQAFLRIFKYIKNYNDQGNLMGWMARITLNTSIDHARKNMRYKKTMFYNEDAPDISVENEVIQQLKSEDLFKLIQRLKPGQRTVFSLYVIDGFKHREIAERLDISQGTSKWHLAEAKKELRSLLEKQMRNSYIA